MNSEMFDQIKAARILIVDDVEANMMLLENLLRQREFLNVQCTTESGKVAAMHAAGPYDLILLDLQMPPPDGIAVMEALRLQASGDEFMPVIVVSASSDSENRLKALQIGARDYILKPFEVPEIMQRIRNHLEVRMLYRERIRESGALEKRVREQVLQLERLSRLQRFFSPQLAEQIVAGVIGDPLKTHRADITAVSIDLRRFTAFTESVEPEDVMEALRQFHSVIGPLILRYQGTIEYFAGDGIMVIFNDPLVMPDSTERAVRMAIEMRAVMEDVVQGWRSHGFDLGMGIGIAQGYATIGTIGFEGRWDYAAVGTVVNLAARLCSEAKAGEIVVDRKVIRRVSDAIEAESAGDIVLKGFAQPVPAYKVMRMREA
jgi:class 3 adenylate cyclase/CheY-like chemotaxis protein